MGCGKSHTVWITKGMSVNLFVRFLCDFCLSDELSVFLSFCCVCQSSVYLLSFCCLSLSICLCLSCLSACLSVNLSVCLSVCLPVCLCSHLYKMTKCTAAAEMMSYNLVTFQRNLPQKHNPPPMHHYLLLLLLLLPSSLSPLSFFPLQHLLNLQKLQWYSHTP